jgi:ribosome biogenesis GTPase
MSAEGPVEGAEAQRLEVLGWSARFAEQFALLAAGGRIPARVAVENRSSYQLYTAVGECKASLAGRFRHEARKKLDLPAVGDWVVLAPATGSGPGLVEAVLPRSSLFTRKAAGRDRHDQIVAANVDVVFIVTSLNSEMNARRLERYLTLAWESGAAPVVVLSKADREHAPELVAAARTAGVGVPLIVTSAKTGQGIDALLEHLRPNRTGALLGSSGVGKSTLINAILGFERQSTGKVREGDDKGRHTTTRRELVLLPGGGILIDTPGMRELQVADAGHGLLAAFDDIQQLAGQCGFGDCTHGPEPDCAVKAAIQSGTLDAKRFESWQKLTRELAHRASWEDKRAGAEAKQKLKVIHKAQSRHPKYQR